MPLVPSALLFYGVMLAVAASWSWLADDALLYAGTQAAGAGVDWARDISAGAAAAAVAILVSQLLTRRTRWGERMGRFLGAVLGRLDWPRCLLLATLSGIAEEALFRGMLQPRVGIVAASLLFGLAHFAPRRDLLPWTLMSIAAGFLLGWLFDATGNLVAPVVAHAGINAVNLRFVSERYAPE
ncbi:MAG TPA: CPBP family intramembrane glutamic endopeptidase [Myxococcota bacterium]